MQSEGKFIIQEPCHEDWTAMTPTQQGRFCAACQKCVIDLTAKQPAEIKEIYDANNGDVCGRMSVSQFVSAPGPRRDELPFTGRTLKRLQMFAVALLATFSLGLHSAKAQSHAIKGKVAHVPSDVRIEGQVKWDHGQDAENVTVEVWAYGVKVQSTTTDGKGRFAFSSLERANYRIVAKAGHWITAELTTDYLSGGKFHYDLQLEDIQVDGGIGRIEEPIIEQVESEVAETPESVGDREIMLGQIAIVNLTPDCEIKVLDPLAPEADLDPINAKSTESEAVSPESAQAKEEIAILDDLELTFYPNPTDGELHLRLKTAPKHTVRILLYDLNGRSLAAQKLEPGVATEGKIDLSRYAAGTYILRLISGKAMVEKRIVKK